MNPTISGNYTSPYVGHFETRKSLEEGDQKVMSHKESLGHGLPIPSPEGLLCELGKDLMLF